jgi:glucokinase
VTAAGHGMGMDSSSWVRTPMAAEKPPAVLAYDVGGTRTKIGLIEAGLVRHMVTIATDEARPRKLLDRAIRVGQELVGRYGSVHAVGLSIRGVVDPQTGVLLDVNQPLTRLIGIPLAALMEDAFGVPAYADNDARMYALGELRHGAGRGYRNLVCLTLGTGIGLGVAIDGSLLRGSRGTLGILGGHFTVQVDGPACTCGNVGCLETLIGAQALVRLFSKRSLESNTPEPALDDISPQRRFGLAASGSPIAAQVVRRFSLVLGSGVVTMIHAYDPDVVVLGGGMSRASAQFLPTVRAFVGKHAWTQPRGRVQVVTSGLGDAAALIGIATLIQDRLLRRP